MKKSCSGSLRGELPPASFSKPPSIHLPHISHPNNAYHKVIHGPQQVRGRHGCSIHDLLENCVEGSWKFSERRSKNTGREAWTVH